MDVEIALHQWTQKSMFPIATLIRGKWELIGRVRRVGINVLAHHLFSANPFMLGATPIRPQPIESESPNWCTSSSLNFLLSLAWHNTGMTQSGTGHFFPWRCFFL